MTLRSHFALGASFLRGLLRFHSKSPAPMLVVFFLLFFFPWLLFLGKKAGAKNDKEEGELI